MKDWEKAVEKFIKPWKAKKDVIGAIVCGSYITGNPSSHSDIDIHIILRSDTSWRERGNLYVDGFLIEYFANTVRKHHEYATNDYEKRRKVNAHMFATGKVLFDKNGELKKLIEYSKKMMNKKYKKPNRVELEIMKYQLWDMNDNLEEVFDVDVDEFFFVYYNYLSVLVNIYSTFLGFNSFPHHKLKLFLFDKTNKLKYKISDFPDEIFSKMIVKALKMKNKKELMNEYTKLTNFVLKKMGGFNIDGWKLRSNT